MLSYYYFIIFGVRLVMKIDIFKYKVATSNISIEGKGVGIVTL